MDSFADYLHTLGGLHDATVVSIDWQIKARTLRFAFEDFYANFRGLPEYPGEWQGTILLRGVSEVEIDVESNDRLRVFEFLSLEKDRSVVTIKFSPGGYITTRFEDVERPPNELRIQKPK